MPLHDVAISTSLSGLKAALLLLLMNSCLSDCVFENESEMEVLTEHYISSVSSPQSYCINSVCATCVLLQLLQCQDDRKESKALESFDMSGVFHMLLAGVSPSKKGACANDGLKVDSQLTKVRSLLLNTLCSSGFVLDAVQHSDHVKNVLRDSWMLINDYGGQFSRCDNLVDGDLFWCILVLHFYLRSLVRNSLVGVLEYDSKVTSFEIDEHENDSNDMYSTFLVALLTFSSDVSWLFMFNSYSMLS